MKEFKTKFGATLFVEELSHDRHYADREDENFIKFFDSKERYVDCLEVATIEENAAYEEVMPEVFLDNYVAALESCESIEDLLETIGIGWYFCSKEWKSVAKYMFNEGVYFDAEKKDIAESDILTHVCVRVFGDWIVVVEEL